MSKTAKGKAQEAASPVKADGHDETGETLRIESAEEAIAIRAYHIYLERGDVEGDPVEDWLQAERELAEGGGR